MLCDRCKKNEATVHIKEFHDGKCTTHHLCNECARETQPVEGVGNIGFNLAEMLFNVDKFAQSLHAEKEKKQIDKSLQTCPKCGWTVDKIRKNDGKTGCPECYHTFNDIIKQAISHFQKGPLHVGKRPGAADESSPALLQAELDSLQKELKLLIVKEEYEAAAICRDRINDLKNSLAEVEDPEK